jgi:hypothetical protein
MKKLLVLMLVLGMATAANATVISWSVDSLTLDINATAVVNLVADDATGYDIKSVGATAGAVASIVDIDPLAAAGQDATATALADPYLGWWNILSADSTGTPMNSIVSGNHFDVTIKGLATGTYAINSDYYGTNDVLNITVVPEPATVALLGLGGLFLLRRRK